MCSRPTAQAHRAGSGHDAVEARAKKRSSRTPQRRAHGAVGAVFRRGYARTLRVTPPWPKAIRARAPRRRTGSSAERSDTRRGGGPRTVLWREGGTPRAAQVRRRGARARGAARRGALAPPERHASPTAPGARLSKPAAALLCPRFPDHDCRCLPGGPETFESSRCWPLRIGGGFSPRVDAGASSGASFERRVYERRVVGLDAGASSGVSFQRRVYERR